MVRSAVGKFAFVVAIAALALPPAAQPQGFPSKPIRIIVPYTPGSPNDVLARLLAQQLQGKLGQAVVVDNKPGGGTTIGSKTAAVAPPDGYTLLFASSALVIEPIMTKQVEYDPLKDFTPIAFVARTSSMLTVNAQVPANSANEFVAYAKANPGKLSVGFAQGTVSQLLAEYFNHRHGLDITSVPYRGGRPRHSRHAGRPHPRLLADAGDGAAAHSRGQDQGARHIEPATQSRFTRRAHHEGARPRPTRA